MKRRIVAFFVFFLVLGLCGGLVWFNFFREKMINGFFATMKQPPQAVSSAEAKPREWTPGILAIGTARAANGVDLAVEVSGVVTKNNVQANRRFAAGEVMVQLDDAVERADIQDAQATVKLYEDNLARSSALRSRGFNTDAAYDQIVAQLATARSRMARNQAIVDQKALKAPFNGVAGISRIDLGQWVQPGTVVTTFQDLSSMKVDFTLPEQAAGQVKAGQSVRFASAEGDWAHSGAVSGIDPKVDPKTRLLSVQAVLADNKELRVLPGQFMRVRVELPVEPNVLTVPQTAVVASLYGDYVFAIEAEDKDGQKRDVVRQVFVKVGRREGRFSEIVSGLKAGDRIVASGQNKIQPGAAVTINNAIDVTQVTPAR